VRFNRIASALVALCLVAPGVGAAEKPAKKVKPSPDYDALFARYLELARSTQTAPNAPRWIDGLMSDPRAHAVNDLLTVHVVENLTASGSADSTLNKSSAGSANIAKLFGLEGKIPGIDPANLASVGADTKFKGGGTTNRSGVLSANVTVRVAEVLPNGDLVLEGAREIGINGDSQVLVLSGVVRQADILPGNVVASTSIGQLRVRYMGNGLMRDSLSPGWLIRVFNKIF
jgi:flagellar L-ring protein FlgH